MTIQSLLEDFEALGFEVTEVKRISDGERIRLDAGPLDPEPVADPLEPVIYPEVSDYAHIKGVGSAEQWGYFPTNFWVFGQSAEMDYQVKRNLKDMHKLKLLGGKFAYARRYRLDGTSVEEPHTQVYLGYTPQEELAGAEPDRDKLVADAKAAIDRAADRWIAGGREIPEFD